MLKLDLLEGHLQNSREGHHNLHSPTKIMAHKIVDLDSEEVGNRGKKGKGQVKELI